MKIGIITYHSSHNYGAYLQAYSLAAFLNEEMKLNAEVINYSLAKAQSVNKNLVVFSYKHIMRWVLLKKRYKMFNSALKRNPYISDKCLVSDNLDEVRTFIENQGYDAIITGSDEIWKLDGYRGFPNAYWLPGIKNIRKIAFAPSSRTEYDKVDDSVKSQINEYLSDYCYIGVRDVVTKHLLDKITDYRYQIHINCDPTFLYDFKLDKSKSKKTIEQCFKIDKNKKTIALMCGIPELSKEIITKHGKQYNIVCLYEMYDKSCRCIKIPNPFEWMNIIAGCDGLITTFYHGLVFSIKNKTPFISIENRILEDPIYSKSYDLLKRNNEEKHFYLFKMDKMDECISRIDSFICTLDVSENKAFANYDEIMKHEYMLASSFIEYLKTI